MKASLPLVRSARPRDHKNSTIPHMTRLSNTSLTQIPISVRQSVTPHERKRSHTIHGPSSVLCLLRTHLPPQLHIQQHKYDSLFNPIAVQQCRHSIRCGQRFSLFFSLSRSFFLSRSLTHSLKWLRTVQNASDGSAQFSMQRLPASLPEAPEHGSEYLSAQSCFPLTSAAVVV